MISGNDVDLKVSNAVIMNMKPIISKTEIMNVTWVFTLILLMVKPFSSILQDTSLLDLGGF